MYKKISNSIGAEARVIESKGKLGKEIKRFQ
jgi:hypothetical protein